VCEYGGNSGPISFRKFESIMKSVNVLVQRLGAADHARNIKAIDPAIRMT